MFGCAPSPGALAAQARKIAGLVSPAAAVIIEALAGQALRTAPGRSRRRRPPRSVCQLRENGCHLGCPHCGQCQNRMKLVRVSDYTPLICWYFRRCQNAGSRLRMCRKVTTPVELSAIRRYWENN
jgi:hypothetical protein